ncbi:unnamed protein product, partial [marine sediment metagenome]
LGALKLSIPIVVVEVAKILKSQSHFDIFTTYNKILIESTLRISLSYR